MRYFTPKLYVEINSDDDDIADAADETWEDCIDEYNEYLATFQSRIPPTAIAISDYSYHDTRILASPAFRRDDEYVIRMREERGQELTLVYETKRDWVSVKQFAGWPFSKEGLHWLYDEFHESAEEGLFVHAVFLSNGEVHTIKFRDIRIEQH